MNSREVKCVTSLTARLALHDLISPEGAVSERKPTETQIKPFFPHNFQVVAATGCVLVLCLWNGIVLHLDRRISLLAIMQIFLALPTQRTVVLDVESSDTIAGINHKLQVC